MSYLNPPYCKIAFVAALLINVCLTVNAQFKRIGLREGLSNNSITTIYQDRYGFMWLGTFDGLNRYDGYEFKVFKNNLRDSLSLPNNRISAIDEDGNGNLWVGTKQGIYRLDKSKLSFFPLYYSPQNNSQLIQKKITHPINALLKLQDGSLLVCTAGEGLFRYEAGAKEAHQIPLQREGRMIYAFHAQAAAVDGNHRLWIFVQNVGLCRYNVERGALELYNGAVWQANCMMLDHEGAIWIGNNNGLHQFEKTGNDSFTYKYNAAVGHRPITSISLDLSGIVWAGSDGSGVFSIDPKTKELLHFSAGESPNQLSSAAVYAIYTDNLNRKWIGTLRGGLNILDKTANRFSSVRRNSHSAKALSSNFILSFCEQDSNNIWIGTDGAGISLWDRRANAFTNYRHDPENRQSLSDNYVVNMVMDEEGNLWAATYGGGINKLDRSSNQFKRYTCFNSEYNYEEVNTWSLYKDREGSIWASALSDGGLYRFNRKEDIFELVDHQLTNILTLAEDEEGQLWGGNFNSLIKIDRVGKQHEWFGMGSAVRDIKPGGDGKLWVATEGQGLKLFDKAKGDFKTYADLDGLPENSVLNIVIDKRHHLWLSTFNGLSEFSPESKSFRNFFAADGLQSNQFNYNAALKLSTGELLFGGIEGFNIFRPENIKSVSCNTPLHITAIRINNKPIQTLDLNVNAKELSEILELELPHDRAVLSVDFAALDYSFQDKINYAFYLEGWEENWNYVGHSRSANYGKLPPGKYVLHIKASDADGEWTKAERLLYVRVLPPWWATRWAYGLYVLTVGALLFSYRCYRRNSLQLRYEVARAKLEKEKEHELNEKKMAFFTHVSHEIRTPLTLIINPLRALLRNNPADQSTLQGIYRNSKRLLSMVDQLLLFKKAESELDRLKPVSLNLGELCQEIYQCYEQQALLEQIDFYLELPESAEPIYADREKIEIILFNLLTNAFKFTPKGGFVRLQLRYSAQEVQVRVEDSGCGIAKEQQKDLFQKFARHAQTQQSGFGIGLYLSKKFAEDHQGSLQYLDMQHKGATFVLSLPRGRSHIADHLIYEDIGHKSTFLEELLEEPIMSLYSDESIYDERNTVEPAALVNTKPLMMIIDDNKEVINYLYLFFEMDFSIIAFCDAEEALLSLANKIPDMVLCDVMMPRTGGLDFVEKMKASKRWRQIPIILLTASTSEENKLKGIELGADDYISKPFNEDHLQARVQALLRQRQTMEENFFEEITLSKQESISEEEVAFLQRCENIILDHLHQEFTIKEFATEIGMSHSALYKKIKRLSGRTANEFMRFVKLRKAAQTLLKEDVNISEVTIIAGFNDLKYFREQFQKEFGMKPSEYVRKYRNAFQKKYQLS
ncbi:two-component regulator propeller domain-containing protein [Olivibacter sp. XZL3]|uniref:hybrid sensor histidine kinase/response regulator transcription factor n=1 Tax=Olivibacter sp. XZL3 TaxID=1735116 RepID=UPI001066A1FE|nr:two-component regulator propeller domain-containing protein [Olivibacter sp. XZL3]